MSNLIKKLRVGTDCSGIEAPIQALIQLNVPFEHVWSCEIDPQCLNTIRQNYTPSIIYEDIRERNTDELPEIDLYVCGFPCQPFSNIGRKKGLLDERGNIFSICMNVIQTKKPSYFILENVKGILTVNDGKMWKLIMKSMKHLQTLGYSVDWKILNTLDYGIPQNRERVYIVGTRTGSRIDLSQMKKKPYKDIETFVDYSDTTVKLPREGTLARKTIDVVIKSNDRVFYPSQQLGRKKICVPKPYCQCILSSGQPFCIPMKRPANTKECLMLQGFPGDFFVSGSNSQQKRQVGNSMSVNVLCAIYGVLFDS